MILLPNNCNRSEFAVFPSNWKTSNKKDLELKWLISYYFRDTRFKEKYPKGKFVRIKSGINRLKTLSERKAAIRILLKNEKEKLEQGYNPITNMYENSFSSEIDEFSTFKESIEFALKNIVSAPSTKSDLKSVVNYLNQGIENLGYNRSLIRDIKRRDLKKILDYLQLNKSLSNKRYNKIRAYTRMLFEELIEIEVIGSNPIDGLKKKKETKELQSILTSAEREKINKYLKPNNYFFWRFIQIFFHSGSRATEIMAIQRKDVNLTKQEFKVLVKKGKSYEYQIRPINKNVLNLWEELVRSTKPNEFLFSKNLIPGSEKISERQITRRWKRHVKNKLNIDVNFYALKHLHTDMIAASNGIKTAKAINGHKSEKTTINHYAVNERQRELNKAKDLNIKF